MNGLLKKTAEALDSSAKMDFKCLLDKWCYGILAGGAFIFLYKNVLVALVVEWWSSNVFTYGFLIPLISFYIAWIRREKLLHVRIRPSYAFGFIIILFSFFILYIGHIGDLMLLQQISLPFCLAGLVMFVYGISVFKILWFPIVYLIVGIPLWDIFTEQLHFPFQNLSAVLSSTLLNTIGISSLRDGIYVALPNITLKVGRMCSGVNFLIAVIALGVPLAYLYLRKWSKRILLITFAVVIAVLSNGFRVTLISLFSYFQIGDALHGPFHIFQGLFVSAIGFIALFAGVHFLSERPFRISHTSEDDQDKNTIMHKKTKTGNNRFPKIFIAIVFIMFGSFLYQHSFPPVSLKSDLNKFPYKITKWTGIDADPAVSLFSGLGVSQELSRIYQTDKGEGLQLYIGYFENQHQAKELIHDKAAELHYQASKLPIQLSDSRGIEINKVILDSELRKRLVLFWYDLNGHIVTDRYKAKLLTIWDAFVRGRKNGAVIIISVDGSESEDFQRKSDIAVDFIQDAYPLLSDYLPSN